jgi:hypothetical protein
MRPHALKFEGTGRWIDEEGEEGKTPLIRQVILCSKNELVVEFHWSLKVYTARMHRNSQGEFEGEFLGRSNERPRTGHARCKFEVLGDEAYLDGIWIEDGVTSRWRVNLHQVLEFNGKATIPTRR